MFRTLKFIEAKIERNLRKSFKLLGEILFLSAEYNYIFNDYSKPLK